MPICTAAVVTCSPVECAFGFNAMTQGRKGAKMRVTCPLTATLSPDGGEGAGTLWASVSPVRFKLLLPLGGEGRDEGVARCQERRLLQAWAACPLTPTLSPDGGEGVESRVNRKS